MKRRRVKRGAKTLSMPSGILLAAGISLAIVVSEALVFAGLLGKEIITEGSFSNFVPILLFLSSLVGSWVGGSKVLDQKAIVCIVSALCFWLTLLGIPALFFDGQYGRVGICALAILAGGGVALFLSTRKPRVKYR